MRWQSGLGEKNSNNSINSNDNKSKNKSNTINNSRGSHVSADHRERKMNYFGGGFAGRGKGAGDATAANPGGTAPANGMEPKRDSGKMQKFLLDCNNGTLADAVIDLVNCKNSDLVVSVLVSANVLLHSRKKQEEFMDMIQQELKVQARVAD